MKQIDDKEQSKWIVGIISDGQKSDYWKLLRMSILEWIKDENKRLDYYKNTGIDGHSDIEKYNRTVDRIRYLKLFLTINETIVNHHKGLIEQVKDKINNLIDLGESFVRRITK